MSRLATRIKGSSKFLINLHGTVKAIYVEACHLANPDEVKAVIARGVKILQDEDVRKEVKNKYEVKSLKKEKESIIMWKETVGNFVQLLMSSCINAAIGKNINAASWKISAAC
ncbi:hypothetical protein Tco_0859241 [Tanacetum coccineum]|uniref:Uncharacterized protein n=1 Tax=Tanacetum coccineum TaxID=301880 RepID=A0ABQ5BD71_9ASTR